MSKINSNNTIHILIDCSRVLTFLFSSVKILVMNESLCKTLRKGNSIMKYMLTPSNPSDYKKCLTPPLCSYYAILQYKLNIFYLYYEFVRLMRL